MAEAGNFKFGVHIDTDEY